MFLLMVRVTDPSCPGRSSARLTRFCGFPAAPSIRPRPFRSGCGPSPWPTPSPTPSTPSRRAPQERRLRGDRVGPGVPRGVLDGDHACGDAPLQGELYRRATRARDEGHLRRARPDRDAATRQRLLDAALRLFSERGFHRVTVSDLCRRPDANLASVNYHFGGQAGPLPRGHGARPRRECEDVPITARPTAPTPEERLRHYVRDLRAPVGDAATGDPVWLQKLIRHEINDPTPRGALHRRGDHTPAHPLPVRRGGRHPGHRPVGPARGAVRAEHPGPVPLPHAQQPPEGGPLPGAAISPKRTSRAGSSTSSRSPWPGSAGSPIRSVVGRKLAAGIRATTVPRRSDTPHRP